MRRFLCWIGWHRWTIVKGSARYGGGWNFAHHMCSDCGTRYSFSDRSKCSHTG